MRNPTAAPPVTQLLRLSIEEQIEAVILQNPDCNRQASLKVDCLLLCADRICGGQW
jgi:hypothetical protein